MSAVVSSVCMDMIVLHCTDCMWKYQCRYLRFSFARCPINAASKHCIRYTMSHFNWLRKCKIVFRYLIHFLFHITNKDTLFSLPFHYAMHYVLQSITFVLENGRYIEILASGMIFILYAVHFMHYRSMQTLYQLVIKQ